MASRKERKVVTVVFADLVGFTSRAEALDPEDVHAILGPYHARLRHELERYGGTVEKFIGDAVMAVFGAPVVHEDDAERGVRAALAIRDWAVEDGGVEVRVAVNTGEALVSVDARPELGEAMVSGDVVNTAARLQSAAPENGVLVGEATHRLTERVIDFRDAEPVETKGKAAPVPVWEAVCARARVGVELAPSRVALVGRARELDVLTGALGRVRDESAPQLLTLVGVPGIGKSRLVRELFDVVAADPELITWRQGRSLPYGDGVTYWALAEMVKAEAGILESDGADEVEAKLARTVAATVDEDEREWVAAHLRPLVGLGEDAGGRSDTRAEAFAAWRRFLEALGDRGPVVLVFDDLHWADDGLLDFVDHVIDWAAAVPMLLVCTARPELLTRRPGWGGGKLNATTVSLSPLSADETARLVHALLDQAVLPADVQAALLERAGGNPLYAEEFARIAAAHGDLAGLPLPESVQGLIAARVDALPADEKDALHHAAVVGRVFWTGAVTALGAGGAETVEVALHALTRKEFVQRERRSSVAGDGEYAFRHGLVREVAYGQIPRARRAELHLAAARWIEALGRPDDYAELLAHHYLSALEYARAAGQDVAPIAEAARGPLREAGDRALALNAYRGAARFYQAALDLWPAGDPARPELLLSLGRATEPFDEPTALAAIAEARAGLAGARAAEAGVLLADLHWRHGEARAARALLDDAAAAVELVPDSPSKAFVVSQLARFHMLASRFEEAERFATAALDMAARLGLDAVRADALNNLSAARFLDDFARAQAELEESIAIFERLGSMQAFRGYNNLTHQLIECGRLGEAEAVSARGLERSERLGYPEWMFWLREKRAQLRFHAGRWDEALALVESELAAIEGGAPHYLETSWRAVRAQILVARGRRQAALDESERSVETARRVGEPQMLQPALALQLSFGPKEPLLDELLESLRDRVGMRSHYWAYLADAARELGRGDEVASAFADRIEADPWVRAAAAIARGQHAAAADVFAAIESLPLEAEYRRRVARALFVAGSRAEAEAELGRALGFWRSVGATAYLQEAESLLEVAS